MKKHKTYSRKKIIKATNISDLIYNQTIKTTNLRQLCRDIGVSEYRVRQILNGESKIDYIRSKETNILWQIEYEFDYVVVNDKKEELKDKVFKILEGIE